MGEVVDAVPEIIEDAPTLLERAREAGKIAKEVKPIFDIARDIGRTTSDIHGSFSKKNNAPTPAISNPQPHALAPLDQTPETPSINFQIYGGPGPGVPQYTPKPVRKSRRPASHRHHARKR
jgi:hypothetical protein